MAWQMRSLCGGLMVLALFEERRGKDCCSACCLVLQHNSATCNATPRLLGYGMATASAQLNQTGVSVLALKQPVGFSWGSTTAPTSLVL